ncbi:hypothetical protein ASD79_17595 [Caulobacter sp. Root655]|uniref:hypothetical protein n=1 Tax=Caulobacter sp. Root655 TaxID=1736578 RepID=UPI0006F7F12E|nr:hypothetical protein [Caulobacter sp. Root655]KRA56173.1 hypothetical protein ASD79_17595 [Caulobacter sp. Root655]
MCSSIRPRRLVRAAVLGTCVAWFAAAAQAGTVETRTPFGRIEMVEEVRTRDPGEPPIMHVATEWTKLHLRWRSADGVMSVDVIDSGGIVQAAIEGADCSASTAYLQYSGVAGEHEIVDGVRTLLALLDKDCPRLPSGATYATTLADGAADFVAAEDGLRSRALILFRRPLTRCLPPPMNRLFPSDPFNPFPCR